MLVQPSLSLSALSAQSWHSCITQQGRCIRSLSKHAFFICSQSTRTEAQHSPYLQRKRVCWRPQATWHTPADSRSRTSVGVALSRKVRVPSWPALLQPQE